MGGAVNLINKAGKRLRTNHGRGNYGKKMTSRTSKKN